MSRIPLHPELLRYIDELGYPLERLEAMGRILTATRDSSELDGEILAAVGEYLLEVATTQRILLHYFWGESEVGLPRSILLGEITRLDAERNGQ